MPENLGSPAAGHAIESTLTVMTQPTTPWVGSLGASDYTDRLNTGKANSAPADGDE